MSSNKQKVFERAEKIKKKRVAIYQSLQNLELNNFNINIVQFSIVFLLKAAGITNKVNNSALNGSYWVANKICFYFST